MEASLSLSRICSFTFVLLQSLSLNSVHCYRFSSLPKCESALLFSQHYRLLHSLIISVHVAEREPRVRRRSRARVRATQPLARRARALLRARRRLDLHEHRYAALHCPGQTSSRRSPFSSCMISTDAAPRNQTPLALSPNPYLLIFFTLLLKIHIGRL